MIVTNPNVTRFIRRFATSQYANTHWQTAMQLGSDEIKTAIWAKANASLDTITMPINNPTIVDFSDENFDAYKQAGNAQSGTGTMRSFFGMACYTIAIPDEANSTFVKKIRFVAGADKFCVGGLKVAAILSDNPSPPTDWDMCRKGGVQGPSIGVPDSSGLFATPDTPDSEGHPVGILAELESELKNSTNKTGEFFLNLSAQTGHYKFVHLVISLFDYQSYRREYWIEGSGLIEPASIQIEYDSVFGVGVIGDVVYIPLYNNNNIVQIRSYGRSVYETTYPDNTTSKYLAKVNGVATFRNAINGGWLATTTPTGTTKHILSISLVDGFQPSSGSVKVLSMLGSISKRMMNVERNLIGLKFWMKTNAASVGKSQMRFSVIDSDFPEVIQTQTLTEEVGLLWPVQLTPGIMQGTGNDILGTAIASGPFAAGDVVGIPIIRNPQKTYMHVIVSWNRLHYDDRNLDLIGFADPSKGFSLVNAHFSREYYPGEINP